MDGAGMGMNGWNIRGAKLAVPQHKKFRLAQVGRYGIEGRGLNHPAHRHAQCGTTLSQAVRSWVKIWLSVGHGGGTLAQMQETTERIWIKSYRQAFSCGTILCQTKHCRGHWWRHRERKTEKGREGETDLAFRRSLLGEKLQIITEKVKYALDEERCSEEALERERERERERDRKRERRERGRERERERERERAGERERDLHRDRGQGGGWGSLGWCD